MQTSQHLNKPKISCRASLRQRLAATAVFLAAAGLFAVLNLAAAEKINLNRWLNPCGFKQRYNLPCPTCGMTTAAIVFSQGKIFKAFYVQPAGALLCLSLAITALFALLTALFGVYFLFLKRFFAEVKVRYIILTLIIVIAAGWAVTLARAVVINY